MGKSQKNYMSIKSKLMAAVAMLLVASFMVVSSTYAWFTLSTAPEVTGIKTTVGANGSLEIALFDTYVKDASGNAITTDIDNIKSTVGDSLLSLTQKNVTWGNLVDLSDDSYGLNKIALLPARLNATKVGDNYTISGAILKTPTYGADGRIDQLLDNTVTGVSENGTFVTSENKGVRVIGTASGMTAQQLGYRNALSTFNTKMDLVVAKASHSLEAAGSLAGVAAGHALAEGEDTNLYDISGFATMLSDLKEARVAIGDVLKALIAMKLAVEITDEMTYQTASTALTDTTIETLMTGTVDDIPTTFTIPTEFTNLYTDYYVNLGTTLTNAETKYQEAIGSDPTQVSYNNITPIYSTGIIDIDALKINGWTADEIKADMSGFILAATGGSITATLEAGSGVHADIAQFAGEDLKASIKLVVPGLIKEPGMSAFMVTDVKVFTNWDNVKTTAGIANAPASTGGNQAKNITDYYGYALDFAFRTNATDSKLLLQTTKANRIYSDGAAETMGNGSTMTFETLDSSFSTADVANLMKAIRLVFVDSTGKIVAIGALSTATAPTTEGTKVTGAIHLYGFDIAADGSLTLGEEKTTDETELMPLEKNKATQLSVYVYLDGDQVDNSDVAATAENSMTGSINLQFSSSAELEPMEYTPFMNQGESGSTTTCTNHVDVADPVDGNCDNCGKPVSST